MSLKEENSQTPSSRRIGSTFGLKAQGYDQNAPFQSLLITKLLESSSPILSRLQKIADLGCGSAFFAKCIRDLSLQCTITGVDIAFESLKLAKSRNSFCIQGDLNALPFKESAFDAIIAASVLQWIEDIDNCVNTLRCILKPNGYFLYAVFTDQSFCELNTVKRQLGISIPVNLHNSSDFINGLVSKQFKMCMSQTFSQTFFFKSARDALKSISSYGATAMASKPLSRKALKELCTLYENMFSTNDGIPLTYSAIIGCSQQGDVK